MKDILLKIKQADWLTFAIATAIIFTKNLLFHYSCFGYLELSSLWKAPIEFFAFYLAKLSPAIFIASFVFISKRRWWLITVCLLLDLWLVADMLYFRANGFFLDAETITLVGNLDGFWSSVVAYINWTVFAIVGTTVALSLYLAFAKRIAFVNHSGNSLASLATCMLIVAVLGLYDWFLGYKNTREALIGNNDGWKYNFITSINKTSKNKSGRNVSYLWIEAQSPMHFFPAMAYSYLHDIITGNNEKKITKADKERIGMFIQEKSPIVHDENLIIIIGESFESWAVELCDDDGNKIMPNLSQYVNADNAMYCSGIKSQVKAGSSGDGQMIINTGLLPMSSGVACMSHAHNKWPNIMESIYSNSYVVNPCANIWNQRQMSRKYGYKKLVHDKAYSHSVGDSAAFTKACNILDTCTQPFAMQVITITTHTPFDCGGKANMRFPDEMPENLRNYLNCMHYADSCIGIFLNKLKESNIMGNTTIVITGDHTIFKKALLSEYQPFAQKYKYPVPKNESHCPLLIISPQIKGNTRIDEECYQMDIYPTIINFIGEEGYSWKGFGVNLMDSTARHNRMITENEAYMLSDKIIRNNYFYRPAPRRPR